MEPHLGRIGVIIAILALCIFYPFFSGEYDSLALPLSTVTQAGTAVALLLVPIGILWLVYEERKQVQIERNHPIRPLRYYFALASIGVLAMVVITVSVAAYATTGIFLGIAAAALGQYILLRLRASLKLLKNEESDDYSSVPLYLVLIPVAATLLQLVLAAPLTNSSREHAIDKSIKLIIDIEQYQNEYGHYPTSLIAVWKDYDPDVVGIEKFHYAPSENGYNLFFEQPRFLLDNLGTREWVVFNPRDEYLMVSHTSGFLLLEPDELERNQGWYAVHDTSHPRWKSFWFEDRKSVV